MKPTEPDFQRRAAAAYVRGLFDRMQSGGELLVSCELLEDGFGSIESAYGYFFPIGGLVAVASHGDGICTVRKI